MTDKIITKYEMPDVFKKTTAMHDKTKVIS